MTLKDLINVTIVSFIKPITILMLSLAVVFFLWNIFQIIAHSGEAEERAKLKTQATWGIIAIAVMVSLWGLVNFFTRTFLNSGVFIPQLKTDPSYQGVIPLQGQ